MSATTLDKRVQKGMEELQKLRDHLKLEIHLAQMDAKDQLAKLEPDLYRAQKLGDQLAQISLKAIDEVQRAIHDYRAALTTRRSNGELTAPKAARTPTVPPPGLR